MVKEDDLSTQGEGRLQPQRGNADRSVADLNDRRDRALIEQIVAGDQPAYAALFREYGQAAYGLALKILNEQTLAEEVVQEVFLAVWRKAANHDPARGSVRSWLLMQIHHRAVDVVRREEAERRRLTANVLPDAGDHSVDDVVEEHWMAARRVQVRKALDVLPAEQRQVIELSYFRGMTQTQVAAELATPLGTVKSRTVAALHRLRGAMISGTMEVT